MKKYCLITGAASGIGFEFAKIFTEHSYNLVLVDINFEELKKIKQNLELKHEVDIHIMNYDLSLPDIAVNIYNKIADLNIKIEVLINNAGFGIYGFFKDISWSKHMDLIQLTVVTNTQLIKLFLNDMLERNSGKILNVSSIAAFQPGPLMSTYYATKTYLLFLSQAIANELIGTNITVTALCPGMTKTMFQKTNGNENPNFGLFSASAHYVAKYGFQAMEKGKVVAIPCFYNRIIANIHRLLPLNLATKISRTIQENSGNSK